jgi:hypothetical protein
MNGGVDKIPAEVAKRKLRDPEGNEQDCWIVTAEEPEGQTRVVFSGYQAADRAVAYARLNYFPLHFRMTCEPGQYSMRGENAEVGKNGLQS